ncbi:MAG: NAD-dependent epimerase/dehydratase family protein [Thermodesulfobacteriota bacterium]
MKGRTVLVAGGSGLVGSALARRLHALGAQVRTSHHERPPAVLPELSRRFDFTRLQDCLDATRGAQDVFVCAAQTFGAQVMRDEPTRLVLPNLCIHANLLEASRLCGVERVAMISSSTVYQEAFHPIREDELDLNRPPFVLYQGVGWMKRYLEQVARFYRDRFGMRIALLRPSNLYGPHDKFEDDRSHVLPALIKRALRREDPFVVWGTGDAVRDFLWVEDFVDDLLAAIERYCTGEPLNVAAGRATTIREAVRTILDVCGHRPEVRFDASKPDAIPYRMLDTTRADAVLGPRRRTSLADGIAATVRWYRDGAELGRAA